MIRKIIGKIIAIPFMALVKLVSIRVLIWGDKAYKELLQECDKRSMKEIFDPLVYSYVKQTFKQALAAHKLLAGAYYRK